MTTVTGSKRERESETNNNSETEKVEKIKKEIKIDDKEKKEEIVENESDNKNSDEKKDEKREEKDEEQEKDEEKDEKKEEKEPITKKPKIDENTNTPKKKIFGTSSNTVSFSSFASYSKASSFNNLNGNNTTFSAFGKKSDDSKDTFASLLKSEGTSFDKKKENDEKSKKFKETDTKTGEEDEECIHSVRAKLYEDENNSWKERGIGLLKINKNKEDKSKVRLVMRVEGVLRVILNERIIPNMKFNVIQDKYISFAAISDSKTIKKYLIKCGTAMSANELYQALTKAIPEEEKK